MLNDDANRLNAEPILYTTLLSNPSYTGRHFISFQAHYDPSRIKPDPRLDHP